MVVAAVALLSSAPVAGQQAPAAAPPRVPPADQQIAAAVLPLPADQRAGAAVLGYQGDLLLVQLRGGTNQMICLADDPRDTRFHVACYHRSLEPYMARGRELRSRGLADPVVDSMRLAEIAGGSLSMPPAAALYSLTGPAGSFDPATGTATGARPLFVVYLPFATGESTGLPTTGTRGAPWLMSAGTARAHIMYAPAM
jgi:hypothetical protein